MMRRVTLVPVLVAAALAHGRADGSAQEGRIAFQRTVGYDFEVPEGWGERGEQIPTGEVTELLLLFTASESVTVPVPETPAAAATGGDRRAERIAARLRSSSTSRSDQETLLEYYASLERSAVVETREFMGRTFLISGARPSRRWKLSGEQREFLGFTVQKATAVEGGATVEAWFTPEIPVAAGPGPYGGLPGMILVVTVDGGKTLYAATDVDLSGLGEATIAAPREGDEVSREEYERIVVEKLEEVRTLAGGRRRPPF